MSDQDRTDKVTQFAAITGVPNERAQFFLDSAAWQVDIALANYYENEGDNQDDQDDVIETLPQRTDNLDLSPQPIENQTPSMASGRPKTRPKKANSKFATLHSLARDDDDDEEEGQAFYAGGSEHSGQQVLGPRKKKDIVADMFKSVQEHGVEVVEQRASTSNPRAFRGTGYKLGEGSNDSVVVPGAPEPQQPSEVTLKLWKDGFSLNEGDLRPYADPSNKDFLDSIRRGEIPQELRTGNEEVHLAMEDHRMDIFRTTVKKQKTFGGQGYTLGNPTPSVVGACRSEDKPVNEQLAKENLKLDSSQPVTSIQIRLADGSRLVAQFNHTHTVGEIRSYILAARPQYATQNFNLMSSYPSKVLEDSQTITDAGIMNSAIMQKIV
ncbi:hypothetical protein WA026_013442 [Henosepilachna vigintioctopunctata]|uniref:NSFL1 cofactor p47 n=1 Tax=Henosepilachna vigintioctopunctata TaxID=420089 RepID=A0AAW1VEU4_9CUCU